MPLAHFQPVQPLSILLSGRFALALGFVLFAYGGWNAAVYLGGEIRRPGRTLPLMYLDLRRA